MLTPAVYASFEDPAVTNDDAALFGWLHQHLDYIVYRAVKQTWAARRLRRGQPAVCRSLTRLVAAGYLAKGPIEGGGKRQGYRMAYQPPTPKQVTDSEVVAVIQKVA